LDRPWAQAAAGSGSEVGLATGAGSVADEGSAAAAAWDMAAAEGSVEADRPRTLLRGRAAVSEVPTATVGMAATAATVHLMTGVAEGAHPTVTALALGATASPSVPEMAGDTRTAIARRARTEMPTATATVIVIVIVIATGTGSVVAAVATVAMMTMARGSAFMKAADRMIRGSGGGKRRW
jgi:hypothetical protein